MSRNYFSIDSCAQDVDCNHTSMVASLMSHPTSTSSVNKNTTNPSTSSYTLTTHSITNSYNDNSDHNNSNIFTAVYKSSLNNPALVKRKRYLKHTPTKLRAMKYCNNSSVGIAIASLSVVFYIIGAIFFSVQLVQLETTLYGSIILQYIFLTTCLVMSIVSGLLIFGIVKRRHIFMLPWIISTVIGIVCDIIYLIVLYNDTKQYRAKEFITYLVGICIQTLIFMNIYSLYKDMKWKYILQEEHKVIWRTHQELTEN